MSKLVSIIALLASTFFIISCGGKAKKANTSSEIIEVVDAEFYIEEMSFNNNWNKLDNTENKLTKEDFNALKLNTLSFMDSYESQQYEIGNTLFNKNDKKLLTIKAISSGEISEYLLGYIGEDISDSLLVAYEDAVEYYSITSSNIENNIITSTTINFDYSGLEEVSDTIISSYRITQELTFDEIIEDKID